MNRFVSPFSVRVTVYTFQFAAKCPAPAPVIAPVAASSVSDAGSAGEIAKTASPSKGCGWIATVSPTVTTLSGYIAASTASPLSDTAISCTAMGSSPLAAPSSAMRKNWDGRLRSLVTWTGTAPGQAEVRELWEMAAQSVQG